MTEMEMIYLYVLEILNLRQRISIKTLTVLYISLYFLAPIKFIMLAVLKEVNKSLLYTLLSYIFIHSIY